MSRSTIRMAVDGATWSSSASATSLVAPRVDSTTSIRSCPGDRVNVVQGPRGDLAFRHASFVPC